MNFDFDKKGLIYASIFGFLIVLIGFTVRTGSKQLVHFLVEQGVFVSSPPVSAIYPQKRIYKALGDEAVLYATGKDVLIKKDELTRNKKDFLFVDLTNKNLVLFQGGSLVKEFPIKSVGKSGSFFETPSGYYSVKSKERNHFSTIGSVWMPWSMHFFGNYFIHGWPYYPNGTPVPEGFSGGCIRLGDVDAKEIFYLTSNGMPVLVYAEENTKPTVTSSYFQKIDSYRAYKAGSNLPKISAISGLAVDLDTGTILFDKNKEKQFPIASVTKLMTGLVAVETINRFKILTITKEALDTYGNTGGLIKGEEFQSQDLLYPLLLASSNDVAELYAEQVWGFVNIMNEKAAALGLTHTTYKDPTGLTAQNVSTTEDLFKLLKFIEAHKKPLFDISSLPDYTMSSRNNLKKHEWHNTTWPVNNGEFIGGKSGLTDAARQSLAAVFRLTMSEGGDRKIAIILLGSDDRKTDAKRIMTYLEKNFVYGNMLVDGKHGEEPPVIIHAGANLFQAVEGLFVR